MFSFGLGAGITWALHGFFGSGFVKGKIWGGGETQTVLQAWRGCWAVGKAGRVVPVWVTLLALVFLSEGESLPGVKLPTTLPRIWFCA